jgi:hypothetical protein
MSLRMHRKGRHQVWPPSRCAFLMSAQRVTRGGGPSAKMKRRHSYGSRNNLVAPDLLFVGECLLELNHEDLCVSKIGYHASHEQFSPTTLLALVRRAEAAGFDCAKSSDHFHPWSEKQGQSGFAGPGSVPQCTPRAFSSGAFLLLATDTTRQSSHRLRQLSPRCSPAAFGWHLGAARRSTRQ